MTVEIAAVRSARPLAIVVVIGIVLYVAIDVTLAFLRPDYTLGLNAESDYGRGPFSWLMDINFGIRGVFSLVAAVALLRIGIARRWTAALVAVWGVASALLAFFPDNPPGYPVLASGIRHDILGLIAFVAIAVATIAMSFSQTTAPRDMRSTLRATSIIGPAAFILLLIPFPAFGDIERVFLASEIAWLGISVAWIVPLGSPKK